MHHILKCEYLQKKLFEILHGRLVSSPSFIYLCNHLIVSVWAHRYLFYTLGYNTIKLLFAQIVPALAIGHSFGLTPKSF